jgi:Protein of unknown function (DUF1580)
MAIDPLSEETFPFTKAARLLPRLRNTKPVHASTLWRWAMSGVRGVRLESLLIGGVRVTSAAALQRFFDRLTQVSRGDPGSSETESDRQKVRIDRELDAAGI